MGDGTSKVKVQLGVVGDNVTFGSKNDEDIGIVSGARTRTIFRAKIAMDSQISFRSLHPAAQLTDFATTTVTSKGGGVVCGYTTNK